MSDEQDALAAMVAALQPLTQIQQRMLTLLETLTNRVEVLELERIDAIPSPALRPDV